MNRKAEVMGELARRELSQTSVARLAGVSAPTVSRILAGKYRLDGIKARRTRERVLQVIAEQTGIAFEDLDTDLGADDAPALAQAS